jgi:hypothetical protein
MQVQALGKLSTDAEQLKEFRRLVQGKTPILLYRIFGVLPLGFCPLAKVTGSRAVNGLVQCGRERRLVVSISWAL